MPAAPTVRYLNNKTREGTVFQVNSFDGVHDWTYTLYTFANMSHAADYGVRTLHPWSPHAGSEGTRIGFGRDARGFVQIITAESGTDRRNNQPYETRTASNWGEEAQDWKAGQPVTTYSKRGG